MIWFGEVSLSKVVFFMTSVCGAILAVASKSVFGAWCGLELGFFGLVPLLVGNSSEESEAGFKYFMVQVIGSGFLVVGLTSLVLEVFMWSMWFFFLIGFMLKMGLFPFHGWVPSVVGYSSWGGLFMVLVVQKIGPFWVLGGFGMPGCVLFWFMFFGVFTSLAGSFGGLNQVNFRLILGYSSLSHSGWLMSLCFFDWHGFVVYFVVYMVLLSMVVLMNTQRGFGTSVAGSCYLLSMGGLPPFLGCLSKIVGVKFLASISPFVVGVLLASSMISLGYYSWIFICLNLKGLGYYLPGEVGGFQHLLFNVAAGAGAVIFTIAF
uniref:NADH-ubiquinone oxidoreductase chain 2 n=1 Tax=Vasticardium flavum TaxID=80826 RepID=A0A516IDI1_9BIVA|nr:NADH dehydrogenase subunit 2 [Vasticardium flavum]